MYTHKDLAKVNMISIGGLLGSVLPSNLLYPVANCSSLWLCPKSYLSNFDPYRKYANIYNVKLVSTMNYVVIVHLFNIVDVNIFF